MKYFQTGFRLSKADKANLKEKGLFVYERRDCGREESIEPAVAVDFLETIVTDFPIAFSPVGPNAYTVFDGDNFLKALGATEVHKISDLEPIPKNKWLKILKAE